MIGAKYGKSLLVLVLTGREDDASVSDYKQRVFRQKQRKLE